MTEPDEQQPSQDEARKRAIKRVGIAVALAAVAAVGLTMLSHRNKPLPQPQQTVLPSEPATATPPPVPAAEPGISSQQAISSVAETPPERDEPPTTAPPPPPQVINQQASEQAGKPAKPLAQKSLREAESSAPPTLVPATPDRSAKLRGEPTPATKEAAAKASEAAARVTDNKKPVELPKPPEIVKPPVAEKAPPPPPPPQTTASSGGGGGSGKGYAVQLGVFKDLTNAMQMQEKLGQHGIQSYTETKLNVGPFKNKAEAEQAMAKLRGMGINAMLVPLK